MSEPVTPNYRSGQQAPQSAPAPRPDLTLVDLLRQHGLEDAETVALVLLRNGYRQPKRVNEHVDVVGMPPTAGLIDGDGELWSAASIDADSFETCGPWHVVYVPEITDVDDTGGTSRR